MNMFSGKLSKLNMNSVQKQKNAKAEAEKQRLKQEMFDELMEKERMMKE